MSEPVFAEVRPSKNRVFERALELAGEDPLLGERLLRLSEFSRTIRTAEVFVTDACNLRCRGCWFFEHDLDKHGPEVRDLDAIRAFAEDLRDSGITHTLILGGEPVLVLDRVRVFAETMRYVTVVTNGTRPVPREGLEGINVGVSLWGGGPVDDELRGHRPNGSSVRGLFQLGLRAYKDDPRAVWMYTLSERGIPYIEDTVRAIAGNGNQVTFGFYSDYGTDPAARLQSQEQVIGEMTRMYETYPEVVIGHPYYFRTLVTGRSHWAAFGADTCASISVDHPAHADRVLSGHPVLRGFNTYRSDHTIQFCCTSGNCGECRDSQAVWTWLVVNMHRFLADAEQLRLWVTLAENFYRQFFWSAYHPANVLDEFDVSSRGKMMADRFGLFCDAIRGDPGALVLRLAPGTDGYRRYEAVRRRSDLVASRRGLLFTASYAIGNQVLRSEHFGAVPTGVSRRNRPGGGAVHPIDDAFISMNPPRHTELRALVNPAFHRRQLPGLVSHIEKTAERCLDALPAAGPVDLISRYAEAVPLATICHILGLPPRDASRFAAWGRLMALFLDGPRTPKDAERSSAVVREMTAYFRERIHHLEPQSQGLVGDFAHSCPARLGLRDAIATCEMLLLGGFGTTVSLIGNALHTLLQRPDLRPANGDHTAVIEESLRHDSPVQYTVRVARADTRLAGRAITSGTPIVVLLGAANRDPEVFDDPYLFTPDRPNASRHLAFGAGTHFCVGATLARTEAAIALNRLFDRYPGIQPAGRPTPLRSRVIHGIQCLPATVRS